MMLRLIHVQGSPVHTFHPPTRLFRSALLKLSGLKALCIHEAPPDSILDDIFFPSLLKRTLKPKFESEVQSFYPFIRRNSQNLRIFSLESCDGWSEFEPHDINRTVSESCRVYRRFGDHGFHATCTTCIKNRPGTRKTETNLSTVLMSGWSSTRQSVHPQYHG